MPRISIHRIEADGVKVFYLEVGPARAPVVLLLHGFPTWLFQYREFDSAEKSVRIAESYSW